MPISARTEYVEARKGAARECGLDIKLFGHAGDGNVHAYVYNDELSDEEFSRKSAEFMEKTYLECIRLGGAITSEHGIGKGKKKYLREKLSEAELAFKRAVKRAFDPELILNPGNLF